jgi:cyclopropane-fatty-acyl-phospholipid synthase
LHYAATLKTWRERFLAHRDEVMRLYDQRFVRMWEFYLACSEMALRGKAAVKGEAATINAPLVTR